MIAEQKLSVYQVLSRTAPAVESGRAGMPRQDPPVCQDTRRAETRLSGREGQGWSYGQPIAPGAPRTSLAACP